MIDLAPIRGFLVHQKTIYQKSGLPPPFFSLAENWLTSFMGKWGDSMNVLKASTSTKTPTARDERHRLRRNRLGMR